MLRERIQSSNYSFLDKLRSIDYLLILLIILLFTISGVIVLDALGIVNFYISEALKNIF